MEQYYGFKHQDAAKCLIDTHSIKRINNVPYLYDGKIYRLDNMRAKIMDTITNLKKHEINEIFDYLMTTEDGLVNFNCRDEDLYEFIGFNNGVWSNKTGQLYPYSPDRICFFKLPIDYNPNAVSKVMDDFLDDVSCHDPNLRKLLEEMVGFCLFPRNEKGKSFFLIGSGANGKTTFLKVVKAMFGDSNVSSLDFEDLNKQFFTHLLIGKLVNIGSDINSKYATGANLFKKLVTGDPVSVDIKFKTPVEFSNTSKFIFAGNRFPRTDDTSDGFMRRLVIIPFLAKFKNDSEDSEIIDKLTTKEALERFAALAVQGYWRMKSEGFTMSESVEEMKRQYEIQSNPIVEFLNTLGDNDEEIDEFLENTTAKDVYSCHYELWIRENNYKPLSSGMFTVEMKGKGFEKKQLWSKKLNKTIWAYKRVKSY